MAALARPVAEVDPHLFDPAVGAEVGHDCDRKTDSPVRTVEVEYHLLEAVSLGNDVFHPLDRGIVLAQPGARFRGKRLEGPCATHAPAYGVVELWRDGERVDQRVEFPGHQTVEVGDGDQLAPALLFHSL